LLRQREYPQPPLPSKNTTRTTINMVSMSLPHLTEEVTSSASGIMKLTKMEICSHRHTFAFCLLFLCHPVQGQGHRFWANGRLTGSYPTCGGISPAKSALLEVISALGVDSGLITGKPEVIPADPICPITSGWPTI
jgi:hypothetical protein